MGVKWIHRNMDPIAHVEIDVGKSKVHRSLGMKIQPEMDFEIKLNCTSDYALG
jgi:hypothetical protein